MTFLVNLGYRFAVPESVIPDGSIILCSAMPMHQLERRRIDKRYPHMENRLFDPQLYLAGLDANASKRHCTYLSSYPWFGVSNLREYQSSSQTQKNWRQEVESKITSLWPRNTPTDPEQIKNAIRDCIDFQQRIGCRGIILPSPLTVDPGTSYEIELFWLDSGLEYIRENDDFNLPIFATIALADFCIRTYDPPENPLLQLVLDAVSAREINGVYVVVEQSSATSDSRHLEDSRALWSILHLTHLFTNDCDLQVGVNFLGQFGLVCLAAGATFWASGWYKSLYRLRLADKLAGGRAYPSYWAHPAAIDIHLESDFDTLGIEEMVQNIADVTLASEGLLQASAQKVAVSNVPAWRYAISNITSAQEHYLLSSVLHNNELFDFQPPTRIDVVEEWLEDATRFSAQISTILGATGRTSTSHVEAWRDALLSYRGAHNV